jgi:hypothetical protein
MAATSLTVQTFVTDTPQQYTGEPLVADMVFTMDNSSNIILIIYNAGASAIETTIVGEGVCEYGATHSLVQSIPAGQTWIFPPLTVSRFQNATAKTVEITTTGTLTNCTIKALRLK